MAYLFTKTLNAQFDDAVDLVIRALKDEGFGVLTTVDEHAALINDPWIGLPVDTQSTDIDTNAKHHLRVADQKCGTMLPCNIVVRDNGEGKIEVLAIDSQDSVPEGKRPRPATSALRVREKLECVIDSLDVSNLERLDPQSACMRLYLKASP